MKLSNDSRAFDRAVVAFIAIVSVLAVLFVVGAAIYIFAHAGDVVGWLGQHGIRGLWCGQDGCK